MRIALLLASALIVVALPASARVDVDWDSNATFASYKTFAWGKGTPAPSELTQGRIEKIVTAALQGEGLSQVESGQDLLVVTHVSTEQRQSVNVTEHGYGYGPRYYRYGYGYSTVDVDVVNYTVGTLVVDVVDAKTGKLVWRGMGEDTVTPDPEKIEKKVQKIVTKMFAKYPPPPAK